ncbi:hypothetical protein KIH74_34595 [Kineosporia sp. J2-2]|uniref:LysM domain-containing protein n=1 Tax=Kineosporia corallincola TaxID=2835133 RepID=A0ABS5TTK4_9ACTN|nr:hypothetical protein [Kineosporia corallincola]MBT0774126.1 hypothetical protein [Kineosporia corallincola]
MSLAPQLLNIGARSRGAALLATALLLVGGLAAQLSRLTVGAWHELRSPGPASPDQAFGLIAGGAATGVTVWLLIAMTVSVIAALSTRTRLATPVSRTARRIAPAAVRNAVAALLGVALIATPTVAQAATFRPADFAAAAVPHPATNPGRTSHQAAAHVGTPDDKPGKVLVLRDFSPGWTPERPRPAATAAAVAESQAAIGVATGTPRRVTADRDPGLHVVVHRGDTLWSITARHLGPKATDTEIAQEWPRWFSVNRHLIGADPHRLLPGERLRVPQAAGEARTLAAQRSSSDAFRKGIER